MGTSLEPAESRKGGWGTLARWHGLHPGSGRPCHSPRSSHFYELITTFSSLFFLKATLLFSLHATRRILTIFDEKILRCLPVAFRRKFRSFKLAFKVIYDLTLTYVSSHLCSTSLLDMLPPGVSELLPTLFAPGGMALSALLLPNVVSLYYIW